MLKEIDPSHLQRIVRMALREDIGSGDITTRLVIPATTLVAADIVAREAAVVCGLDAAREVFASLNKRVIFKAMVKEGARVNAGTVLARVKGNARALLTAERVSLNFLGRLSGIATLTRAFVDEVKGTPAVILDTRKTTPGLRELERYAVCCGGGENHRFDLGSMVLVKDNHRVLSGQTMSLASLVARIRKGTTTLVEVEVDSLEELQDVLACPPDMVLLDNMSPAQMRQAVAMVQKIEKNRRPLTEASGGITLKNVRLAASSGVDRISIGALTHSARCIDVSFEFH